MKLDTKTLILIGACVAALSQASNFLNGLSWLIQSPFVAYAGQAVAQKVDEEFKEYLNAQKASTEAIKNYIAIQQRQTPVAPIEELSDDGEVKEMIWTDKDGKTHHGCCQGTKCWAWHKQTHCERE